MKSSAIFWSVFFIIFGLLLLLNQFSYNFFDYSILINLWPFIFIFWGISILRTNETIKKIFLILFAVFIAFMIMSFCSELGLIKNLHKTEYIAENNDDVQYKKKYLHTENEIKYPMNDKIEFADLNIDGGACDIDITEIDMNSYLLYALSNLSFSNFNFSTENKDGKIILNLDMDFDFKFNNSFSENNLDIRLNTTPEWDFDIDVGAVDFESDLRNFKVNNFELSSGASDIELWFGKKNKKINVDIQAGASDITINIPRNSGCKIYSTTALSNKDFYGFKNMDDYYLTENFSLAKDFIIINISGGVSNFEVKRY
jgi:hypothetical protein